jgi:sec-independent protein translocase protein TatB
MFGIDFSEILVIFVIALVVLGPEKLPKLAATIGRWLGRARLMARQFREQLEQEASRLQDTAAPNIHRPPPGQTYPGHSSSYDGASYPGGPPADGAPGHGTAEAHTTSDPAGTVPEPHAATQPTANELNAATEPVVHAGAESAPHAPDTASAAATPPAAAADTVPVTNAPGPQQQSAPVKPHERGA